MWSHLIYLFIVSISCSSKFAVQSFVINSQWNSKQKKNTKHEKFRWTLTTPYSMEHNILDRQTLLMTTAGNEGNSKSLNQTIPPPDEIQKTDKRRFLGLFSSHSVKNAKKKTQKRRFLGFIADHMTKKSEKSSPRIPSYLSNSRLHMYATTLVDAARDLNYNIPITSLPRDWYNLFNGIHDRLFSMHSAKNANVTKTLWKISSNGNAEPLEIMIVLPPVIPPMQNTTENVAIKTLKRANEYSAARVQKKGNVTSTDKGIKKWSKSFMELQLQSLILNSSVEPAENLTICCVPLGNVLARLLRHGEVSSDISICFKKLFVHNFKVSGGGHFVAKGVSLNVLSFLPPGWLSLLQQARLARNSAHRRFPSTFKVYATQWTLNNEDLRQSSCVRYGLSTLLRMILRRPKSLGALRDVIVHSVHILPTDKIACKGIIITTLGTKIPFEVRSMIRTSSRGHALEFPGLEVSLSSQVFIPVFPEVTVYLGKHFRFVDLAVNGSSCSLQFSAKAKIHPLPMNMMDIHNAQGDPQENNERKKYMNRNKYLSLHPSSRQGAASYYCDAADWLASVCRIRS